MKITSVVLALVLASGMAAATEKPNLNQQTASLSSNNELLLPANYRSWVAVAASMPGMPTHHHRHLVSKIYVEPTAYDGFVKHGVWPDHTVIVLELRDKATPGKTVCDGLIGLEVAAKNNTRRPDPWSYYGIIYDRHKNAASTAETKKSCDGCDGSPTDMRLAMYFPTLRAVIHATPRSMQPSAF